MTNREDLSVNIERCRFVRTYGATVMRKVMVSSALYTPTSHNLLFSHWIKVPLFISSHTISCFTQKYLRLSHFTLTLKANRYAGFGVPLYCIIMLCLAKIQKKTNKKIKIIQENHTKCEAQESDLNVFLKASFNQQVLPRVSTQTQPVSKSLSSSLPSGSMRSAGFSPFSFSASTLAPRERRYLKEELYLTF